jgi:hypothetical protein
MDFQKLVYCDKNVSNTATCGKVATHQGYLSSKKDNSIIASKAFCYRCDEHKDTGTVNRKPKDMRPFDQSYSLHMTTEYLKSLIGKSITSKWHRADKELVVKMVKPNGGVMCQNPHTKKWKFVYAKQITLIPDL